MKKKRVLWMVLMFVFFIFVGHTEAQKKIGRLVLLTQQCKQVGFYLYFAGRVRVELESVYWAPRLVITGPGLAHWDRVQNWRWTQPNEVVKFEFRVPVSEFQLGKEYRWYFHPLTKLGLEGFASTEKTFNLGSTPLLRVYPNPFNPTTTIEFNVNQASRVELSIYNALGQRVAVLMNGRKDAGYYKVIFDAKDLPAGIYIVKLSVGRGFFARRIVLTK